MRKVSLVLAASVAALALLSFAAAYWIDEPLRRRVERDLNAALKGYTVRIGRLDFHPIGFSFDLEDSTIRQNEHPEPPVAHIPNLGASVEWKALLFGRIVADIEFDDPRIVIDLRQTQKEIADETPMKERGWQEALQAIYPLKINEFVVRNADLTYRDKGPFPPLRLRGLNFRAENIRNVRSGPGKYPSPVHLEGSVFEKGRLALGGNADFLAEPHVAFKANLRVDRVDLAYFKPILERHRIAVSRGLLSGAGTMEYAAHVKTIEVPELLIQGAEVEYIHEKETTSPTEEIAGETDRAGRKYGGRPDLAVRVRRAAMNDSRLGFVNRAADPRYRVFLSDANVKLENFSNQPQDGATVARAAGKFMGSGHSRMVARFRPAADGPDLDLDVSIEGADMRAMNDMIRAYGKFDVTAGIFSFYSEISVRKGRVRGYVKPLFSHVDVYDPRQDKEKNLLRKIYEGIIGGLSWVFEDSSRDQVATETAISGKLSDPRTSTLQAFLGLVQNAYFKAILPGLERQISSGDRAAAGDRQNDAAVDFSLRGPSP